MKLRRVMITIEAETDVPLKYLRNRMFFSGYPSGKIAGAFVNWIMTAKQVQVNVIKNKK